MSSECDRYAGPSFAITASVVADDPGMGRTATELLEGQGIEIVSGSNPIVLLLADAASERLQRIRERIRVHPADVIIAAMPADAGRSALRAVLAAGVRGIVLDDQLRSTLAATVVAVEAGQLVIPPSLRRQLTPPALSYRERQLLSLVVDGYTNRQIADRLYLAESTVKSHLYSAFSKLDARSRAEATALILDPEAGSGLGVLELSAASHPSQLAGGS